MQSPAFLAGLVVLAAASLAGAGPNFDHLGDAERKLFQERFTKEVWPLFERNGKQSCIGCHASGKGGNGLKMTGKADKDFAKLLKEGFFLPNDSGSVLTRVMSREKKRQMPPPGKGEPWTKEDIAVLQTFIADLDKKQQRK